MPQTKKKLAKNIFGVANSLLSPSLAALCMLKFLHKPKKFYFCIFFCIFSTKFWYILLKNNKNASNEKKVGKKHFRHAQTALITEPRTTRYGRNLRETEIFVFDHLFFLFFWRFIIIF